MTKTIDFLQLNQEAGGKTLPVEREMLMKRLVEIPADIAREYGVAFGRSVEEQLVLLNIIVSCDRPHLIKHLIDGLSEDQLCRLRTIATSLASAEVDHRIDEIIDAALGVRYPTPQSKTKADQLISIVKSLSITGKQTVNELADLARLIRILCLIIEECRTEADADYLSKRVALLPEDDIDWLLDVGVKQLVGKG